MTTSAEMQNIESRLASIETKIDMLIDSFEKQNDDKEARIRTLEQRSWKQIGAFGVLSLLGAFVVKIWK